MKTRTIGINYGMIWKFGGHVRKKKLFTNCDDRDRNSLMEQPSNKELMEIPGIDIGEQKRVSHRNKRF